ncbi:MAG TPA: 6-bladed beta-propeller [Gemmatimonadales bacterium]|nr:6-bladed beta-propeller [Gemmatimonadales bacterium]
MRTLALPASFLGLLAACGGQEASTGGAAGLANVFDSTSDTLVARVSGAVPPAAVRSLVREMAIAPDVDDVSLFTQVSEFDVDPEGRFWVYDSPSSSIFLFSPNGVLLRRIGRQGAGPGEFNQNNGMVVLPDGRLAQLDARNGRISFLAQDGSFEHSWVVPTGFNTSNGLVTDRSGQLYLRRPVTPPREGEILGRMGLVRLREEGAFGDSLAAIDLPVQRETYVARREGSTSSTGSRYAPNYFWTWHPEGYFVAAHGGRGEVVLERPNRPIVIRREMPAVPVSGEERDQEQASITWNMRQTEPGWAWRGPELPTTKAPILGLFAARDGRIWVRVAAPSELIPDAELPVTRDTLRPVVRFRTPVLYEVYDPNGSFVGRVEFPSRATLMEADGDVVWALDRNEDDLPAVTRFRVEPGLGGSEQ